MIISLYYLENPQSSLGAKKLSSSCNTDSSIYWQDVDGDSVGY